MKAEVAIIGAGSVGIAVAYYLVTRHQLRDVVLLEAGDPMALTSAQSGENYRNWWPHPVMTAFTDDSIGLMEEIAAASGNRFHMTRRGYALATRRPDAARLIEDLHRGYRAQADGLIRMHRAGSRTYRPADAARWDAAPDGVDVLGDRVTIRQHFPSFSDDVRAVLHIRRAGAISGQQLGQFMLEAIRAAGGRLLRARVTGIEGARPSVLRWDGGELRADHVVNAAGPAFAAVADMMGGAPDVETIFQQKIAFEDRAGIIPRNMPFAIDLDPQAIAWTAEERAVLAEDAAGAALLETKPGGVHCRPDGVGGTWIKLGWAYNRTPSDPAGEPPTDPQFPDIVLRGASQLHPRLRDYVGRLPRGARHYGGYYVMTPENWPLIGKMRREGAFMAGALSGFGTMAACAAGALCAAWVTGGALPAYAVALSAARYQDAGLMAELDAMNSTGVL